MLVYSKYCWDVLLSLNKSLLEVLAEINKAWNWSGFIASEVILTNDFGNIIFKTENDGYWRICPEEVSCFKIADNSSALQLLLTDPEFDLDWKMSRLVNLAESELGTLEPDQKFCLKMPTLFGGKYEKENFGKISFSELIQFSGNLGFQTKDLKDGDQVTISPINLPKPL